MYDKIKYVSNLIFDFVFQYKYPVNSWISTNCGLKHQREINRKYYYYVGKWLYSVRKTVNLLGNSATLLVNTDNVTMLGNKATMLGNYATLLENTVITLLGNTATLLRSTGTMLENIATLSGKTDTSLFGSRQYVLYNLEQLNKKNE